MPVTIVNNRIDGLRVTVFDVLHYLQAGRSTEEILDILPLTTEQVEETVRYIEQHRDEVMAIHQRIEERIARGNSPEIEARATAGRVRMEALRKSKASAHPLDVVTETLRGVGRLYLPDSEDLLLGLL